MPESVYDVVRGRLLARAAADAQWRPILIEAGACDGSVLHGLLAGLRKPRLALAVEVDPRNFAKLVTRKFPYPVTCLHAAVAEQDGVASLYPSACDPAAKEVASLGVEYSGSSTVCKPVLENQNRWFPFLTWKAPVEVPARSLDSLASEHRIDHADLVWADIEGGEGALIRGGERLLRRTKLLFVEAYGGAMYEGAWTREEVMAEMASRGWSVLLDRGSDLLFENPAA